jgi:hypothetical protein
LLASGWMLVNIIPFLKTIFLQFSCFCLSALSVVRLI